jgi:bacterioferritin-associated ferredoxin
MESLAGVNDSMCVCICNAIRETDFRRAARCVPGNAEAVYAALGKVPQCRNCLPEAEAILLEERSRLPALADVA